MRIDIDPRDAGRVRVVADIEEETPIEAGTVAVLSLQGVTGLLTINLQPRSSGTAQQPPIESLKFPVIPSEQSQFDVLVSSLPDVTARAGEALDRVNSLLSDENLAAITATLGHAQRASADLPAAVADARVTFHELEEAANEMQATMEGLGALSGTGGQDIKAAAARLREVADTLSLTAARFDRLVAENEGNVDRFAEEGLADFEQLVRETRSAVRSFDALTRSLEQDPSRVIYRPAPAGVEIPP
jgi:phospholipid/cholesterol/gamma-HCH transport system substrate-binding protein